MEEKIIKLEYNHTDCIREYCVGINSVVKIKQYIDTYGAVVYYDITFND